MDIKQRVASCYKIPRMTAFIEEDLRQIKKINQLLVKLEKNPDKENYILEILNLLRTLLNVMDFNSLYLLMCEIIDFRFHYSLHYLFETIDNLNSPDSVQVIRKFQDIADKDSISEGNDE